MLTQSDDALIREVGAGLRIAFRNEIRAKLIEALEPELEPLVRHIAERLSCDVSKWFDGQAQEYQMRTRVEICDARTSEPTTNG